MQTKQQKKHYSINLIGNAQEGDLKEKDGQLKELQEIDKFILDKALPDPLKLSIMGEEFLLD